MRAPFMMTRPLPRTAKDIFRLSPAEWVIYNGVISIARLTGLWRHPIAASGDFETMGLRDKIYWLYKAQYPIVQAVKGSGLAAYFSNPVARCVLPPDFTSLREVTLSAVGDLMDHPFLPHSTGYVYERVADTIFGADISIANLECVVYPEGSGSFVIRSTETPPLYYKAPNFDAARGFEGRQYSLMSTACNHSLDCGEEGVASTIGALRAARIAFHGMNESEDDAGSATLIEKNGFRIGFVSHTFGLNGKRPPAGKTWIVNRSHLNGRMADIDFTLLERQIEFCKNNEVDAVVALLHWGMEHEYYPRPDQLAVGHHLAELGVDVVIGHHPHVIQPMECYRTTRDPDRIVPIYYSLGNLITPFTHCAFRRSAVARITLAKGLTRDGSMGTYVKDATAVQVFQEIDEGLEKIALTLV